MSGPAAGPPQSLQALQAAIATLESQRALLGDAVVDVAVAGLQVQAQALQAAGSEPTQSQALRLVSILFLDVVGSTALGQRLDPEEIHAVMDGAMARFTAVVQAHGGRVLQYAGDNLLAGFGADEVREDDAERALRCGLALLTAGRGVAQQVLDAHGHHGFDVRVGIHSGQVLLGGGVDAEGTIRGSAVNIAARMEQCAPPGGLLISLDTYRLVQDRFDVQQGQALHIKGVDAPMLTFRVERERPRSAQQLRHGLDAVNAGLVGRDADLAEMRAALAAVQTGRTQRQITVIGDAGLGKTRLLAEFEAGLSTQGGPLHASAHPQGLHQPYGVIRDLLFRCFDVQDSDPLALAQAKLADGLAPLFGERADEQTALLGQLIGLDYQASPFIAGILQDGRQLRARALHAWIEFLRLSCARLPPPAVLVLMLDDLHWADEGSLDAIEQLCAVGGELPLLLLCAARPELLERRPDWAETWPACTRLALAPLDLTDRQTLARSLLRQLGEPAGAAAQQLQTLLIERTDGNPFHMEALLQMLVDQGELDISATPWRLAAGGLQRLQVPTTLVGVLQARLDALLMPQRRALQQASVIGAVFWDEALAALDGHAPAALGALSQRGLVLPQDGGAFADAMEFAFRHHLLHDVTYGTVLKHDRREQHRCAALWLEARSAGRGAEFAGLIAEHFERAGLPDRAAEHWARAAQQAVARHADSAALAHACRALALDAGADPQRRFAMLRVCTHAWSRRGDEAEYEQAVAALEAEADAQDDAVLRLIAAQHRMHRLCQNGDYEPAHALGLSRLAAAGERAPAEAAKVHSTLIMALGRQGRHQEARLHAQAALTLARACEDSYTEASVLNNLSVGYAAERLFQQAFASGEQALAKYRSIGSRYGEAIALLNLAFAAQQCGLVEQSREQLCQLLQLCDAIDHRQIGAQARCNLAGVLVELGQAPQALDHALDGVRMAEGIGDRYIQCTGHDAAFQACYLLGRWREAVEHGRLAQAGLAASGEPAQALACEAGVACALQKAGDDSGARAGVEAVLATVAGRGGWQDDEADAAIWCARVLALQQDPRAAVTLAAARRGLIAQAAIFEDPIERAQFLQATALRRELQLT
ncbi:ATP-binding protein [Roseateles cavernae]|uniref:ATP-binding protein n=1 Tax=Roseateles cavernae TaxID=3153578 RepID=UPI0032E4D72E